jgi:hypothetical protein
MKTLTIKNPWALLIAAGIKDIENRIWRTKFKGRIYIHAGQSLACKPLELDELLTPDQFKIVNTYEVYRQVLGLGFKQSCIIGEVDIIDCVINAPSIWAERTDLSEGAVFNPIYNWVLANPVLYDKPIENVRGKLSFWEYELNR